MNLIIYFIKIIIYIHKCKQDNRLLSYCAMARNGIMLTTKTGHRNAYATAHMQLSLHITTLLFIQSLLSIGPMKAITLNNINVDNGPFHKYVQHTLMVLPRLHNSQADDEHKEIVSQIRYNTLQINSVIIMLVGIMLTMPKRHLTRAPTHQ